MAKQKHSQTKKIQNRRARFDYALEDGLMAGIVLSGKETKALRLGNGSLRGAYVTFKNGELWLINATISGFSGAPINETDQTRARKLLLKKREIEQLEQDKKQGKTIVPLELLTSGRYIKVRIASGKGKKHYDKRETIKRRDQGREAARQLSSKA